MGAQEKPAESRTANYDHAYRLARVLADDWRPAHLTRAEPTIHQHPETFVIDRLDCPLEHTETAAPIAETAVERYALAWLWCAARIGHQEQFLRDRLVDLEQEIVRIQVLRSQ